MNLFVNNLFLLTCVGLLRVVRWLGVASVFLAEVDGDLKAKLSAAGFVGGLGVVLTWIFFEQLDGDFEGTEA